MLLFITGFILYWVVGIVILSLLAKLDLVSLTLNDVQNKKGEALVCVGVWWIILIVVVCKRIPSACSATMGFVMKKVFRIPEQATTDNQASIDDGAVGVPDQPLSAGFFSPALSSTAAKMSASTKKTKKEKPKKMVKKDRADRFKLMDL